MRSIAELSHRHPVRHAVDAVRGFLIGMAELVPGVSGGTVALVTGVYDELIDSASHVIAAGRRLVTGPGRRAGALEELRRTDWWLVVPILVGMAAAVLTMAGVMGRFVTDHPEHARGLFFGLVATSILVPLGMLPREPGRSPARRVRDVLLPTLAAVLAFWLTGLSSDGVVDDPAPYVVFLAAAVAICALVVPGVSGSFFLLAVGLYQPTLAAVDARDLAYVGVFAAGALAGLASFVKLLHHLLHRRRRGTLLVMIGLMLGSLRALWPWQGEGAGGDGEHRGAGELLWPAEPVAGPVAGPLVLAVLGALVVLAAITVERRVTAGPDSTSDVPVSGG
jgi:putative membrane protein